MTEYKRRTRLPAAGMAALAALMLSGCAGTHVGDAWQCPLAQGEVCASVAAADPAVTGAGEREGLAAASPLHRPREGAAALREAEPRKDRDCDTGCNPLDWLAGLFAVDGDGIDGDDETAVSGPRQPAPETAPPSQAPIAQATTEETGAQAASSMEDGGSAADTLRTPETIGRVWIAPFVDAGGVYREASWVRIVIAPAAWRLP